MTASEQKRISLIIATYNRAKPLERLLGDMARQTLPREAFEVVVCVDGSTDGTGEVLERLRTTAPFPLVALYQENQGQSVARHQAIIHASGQRVVVVDDDMELSPGFLQAHLDAAQSDPSRVVVIGKVVPESGWQRKPLYEAVREHSMMLLHERLETGAQAPSATAFVTQNVSMPRRLYLDVGGFDASLRLDEDRELGMRLERAGGLLVFSPEASAVHRSDVGSYDKWEQRQYEYGKFAVQIWEKYGRDPYLHPLRNLINGNPANRAAVNLLSRWDWAAKRGSRFLRELGERLANAGLLTPGLATHKAILAVQYHLGVKHALGSWTSLRNEADAFKKDPHRPHEPTGRGTTRASKP
jgi:glycosyltransferase involved in cell wall biosynthesis